MIKNNFTEIKSFAKNLIGWKTNRKIVVFSVDDYGNVRIADKSARDALDNAGLHAMSNFDVFDSLEDAADLEQLYNALTSVKDSNGRYAVFTPFTVLANINFERVIENNYDQYYYELLPETFEKLQGYRNTWDLWQQGIDSGIMAPQYHGREHLNLKIFNEKLTRRDHDLMVNLQNRSYSRIINPGYKTISVTGAYMLWDLKEIDLLREIIIDGLHLFERAFGYKATHFNAPGGREHPLLHPDLCNGGIQFLDTERFQRLHEGYGKHRLILNYTGKRNHYGQIFMVKNCVFEPTEKRNLDWVSYTLKQVEYAFKLNKPANISSHRVNFSGHIDPNNRKVGLTALKRLLLEIVKRWPNVEFMSSVELLSLI